MHFIISKLTFDAQASKPKDARELSNLAEKLRHRFRISVQIADEFQRSGVAAIVIAAVHPHEQVLNQLVDDIVDVCENSGFGRIQSENTIFENFESYNEEYE